MHLKIYGVNCHFACTSAYSTYSCARAAVLLPPTQTTRPGRPPHLNWRIEKKYMRRIKTIYAIFTHTHYTHKKKAIHKKLKKEI